MPDRLPPGSPGEDERTVIRPGRAAAPPQPGNVIGHTYRIESLVSRSGIGEVYRARHVELGTVHAIKIIPPALADNAASARLLVEEARKLARLRDDAIVGYEGLLRDDQGRPCLVMEFVEGETLAAVLARRRLEPDEVARLRERLARGLAVAHGGGIVHRDLSPDSVILPDGNPDRAKLADFAIAQGAGHDDSTLIGGRLAAALRYAAPEQLGLFGGRIDARTDIYRLGLVLAAAALGFGQALEMGSTPAEALAARQKPPDLSPLPPPLRPLLAPMLNPQPADRPASMQAVLDGDRPPPPAAAAAPGSRAGRNRLLLAAGAVAALAVLGAVAWRLANPPVSETELRAQLAAALAGYRCAALHYTLAPDRSVQVSGHVATGADLARLRQAVGHVRGAGQTTVAAGLMPWPHCEVASILAALLDRPARDRPLLALAGAARIGDRLAIDARMPGFDGYVDIDYFTAGGQVLHLFPNARDVLNIRPAYNRFVLFKPPLHSCWTYSGTAGRQLVALTVAPEPLFPDHRPEIESARDYLPALATAIGRLPPGAGAAALLFIDLRAAAPWANAGAACPSG